MIIATDRGEIKSSVMSGKLKDIKAINTNTLTNPYCSKMRETDAICNQCYSAAMLSGSRKNCQPRFEQNSVLLSSVELTERDIPRVYDDVVRLHGHGELINSLHYKNFCKLAELNPSTLFVLWTKRRELIRGIERPSNLQLIYSNPSKTTLMKRVPKGFDKVFNALEGERDDINCFQNCRDCMLCYTKNDTQIIIEKIKKRT